MDLVLDPKTLTKKEFEDILQQTFANMNDYEKQSIEVILNLFKSSEELKENKLRMSKYIVEDIDKLLKLVRLSNGKKEDIETIINEIKALQSNVSSYMETSDEDVLESIKRNINEINETNKRLIENKQEYVSDEEKKEKEELKNKELKYLSERQNKLHQKLHTEIAKELKSLNNEIKPFDFKKLDKAYRNLYVAIDKEDKEEIINKRGRLIRLLEANKKEIEEQYKKVKDLEEIKEVFELEEVQEIKMQKINEILKENKTFSLYFSNATTYEELRKEFNDLYEFLEVKKTRLYKEALKEELKTHGVELKEAYNRELLDKKHQSSTLTQALPMTMGLSIQKLSNTMAELRNTNSKRKQKELRKEALSDFGRVIATPAANIVKFTANNWYTLSLLQNGYKTAKEQKEAEEKAKAEAEAAAAATEVPTEEATQDPPAHVGAQYDDPEFEEEVIRLMKSGDYNSIDAAEHQALINLGRIEPDQPEVSVPDTPHAGVQYADPEFEEEVIRLMKSGDYNSIDAAEHQALINLGRIEPDPPKVNDSAELTGSSPNQDGGEQALEGTVGEELSGRGDGGGTEPTEVDPPEIIVNEPPTLSTTKQALSDAEVGIPVVMTSSQNNSIYVVVKNDSGSFDITEYENGIIVCTYTGLGLNHISDTFTVVSTDELPALLASEGINLGLNNAQNQNPALEIATDTQTDNTPAQPSAAERYPDLVNAQMTSILPASSAFNGNIYEQLRAGMIDGDSPVRVWYFPNGASRWPWNERSITLSMRDAQELFNWCTEINFDEYQVGVGHISK